MPSYWRIEGYDSAKLIYQKYVRESCMSKAQLRNALQCLAAKAGLNNDEIIGAYAKKTANITNRLLDIHKGKRHELRCGDNPHFCAVIIQRANEKVDHAD
jgi:AICAR transformylase/IMP cyclohydrolase PurH